MQPPIRLRYRLLIHLWFPVFLWLAVISYFSSRSVLPPPFSYRSRLGAFFQGVAHFGEFAILTTLLHRALKEYGSWGAGVRGRVTGGKPVGNPHAPEQFRSSAQIAFAAGLLFAFLDEFHQSRVPNRDFELADIGCDMAGVIATLGLIWMVENGRGRMESGSCQR